MTQLTDLIMDSKEKAEIAPALICLGVRDKAHTMLSLSVIMEPLAFAKALSSLIQSEQTKNMAHIPFAGLKLLGAKVIGISREQKVRLGGSVDMMLW